jgi:hypothetical protein
MTMLLQEHRCSIALLVLTEIRPALQAEGYEITKPKRLKRESGMSQCRLGDGCGIDLVLSPQQNIRAGLVFLLVGFGFMHNTKNQSDGERRVREAWKRVQVVFEQTMSDTSVQLEISWLSPDQLADWHKQHR